MNRLYLYIILAVAAVLMIGSDPVQAQRVDAYLSEDSAYVGDRFTLTFIAMHGFDQIPSFPSPDSNFGDFIPVNSLPLYAGTKYLESDARLDSVVYEVTTFALDTARLTPMVIGFANDSVTALTSERDLLVNSLVSQDAEGIRDMAPPIDFGRPLWPYVFLGLAAVIAGLLIWYMIRRRRKPDIFPPDETENLDTPSPATIALERLHALENTPLTNRPQVEAYYVELSEALRCYIEHRLRIPALESTTQELIQNLVSPDIQHQIPSGVPGQLEQILSLADLVKFADVTPSIPEGRSSLEEAITIIRRVEIKFDQRAASEKLAPSS
ncbi:MAG: BatA domain-containing protein [Bacteroidetes bacterium]|nr:BatA domain-containing protein [Bacteroidota bacterium]